MSDLEGVLLGDYLLLHSLCKGGIADVYRARRMNEVDTEGGHDVVVKVFRPMHARREAFREYFLGVADKLGQLDHQHILPCLEYGDGEDLLYLVTPFVASGTLDDLLQRVGGRFSAMQALPIMQQLCNAIQYAHEQGVIHGNIKPGNIFVGPDGCILLTDFGIVRGYDDSQQSLTRVGWGLAEYAAPEQSLGIVKKASDIYALGVLLFRILTGVPPFGGQTPVEVLLKHVRQPAPSARAIVPSISDAVNGVILMAMQKRADARFASAEELSHALQIAVMMAPVASPVARKIVPAQIAISSGQLPRTTQTLSNASMMDPKTPVPPFVAFGTPEVSVSPQTPVPQLEFPQPSQFSPSLFAPPLFNLSSINAMDDPDITQVRKKNFLQDDTRDDASLLWSADPAEWSPLAQDGSGNEALPIPLTAGGYLEKTPVVALMQDEQTLRRQQNQPEQTGIANKQDEKDANDTIEKPQERSLLHRWLPFIVVFLLLIGLLGALLSAFLFPPHSQQSGAYQPARMQYSHITFAHENNAANDDAHWLIVMRE